MELGVELVQKILDGSANVADGLLAAEVAVRVQKLRASSLTAGQLEVIEALADHAAAKVFQKLKAVH